MKIKRNKIFASLIVLIAFVIAASIYVLAQNRNRGVDNFQTSSETSSNDGALSNKDTIDNSSLPTELIKNLPGAVSVFELRAVDGQSGSVTAVAVADGENLALAVEASLADPSGKFYYAWLSYDSGNKNLQLLGKLEEKEGKYVLPANVKGPLTNYQKLVITIESNEDNRPETVILEGKVTS